MNKKELQQKMKEKRYYECVLILREEIINILTEKVKKEDEYFIFSTTRDLYNKSKTTLKYDEIQVAYKLYNLDIMYERDEYVLDQMIQMYQEIK